MTLVFGSPLAVMLRDPAACRIFAQTCFHSSLPVSIVQMHVILNCRFVSCAGW